MENENLIVLNGRTSSDSPANVTYIGAKGKSIIDLVWVDLSVLSLINDLIVNDEITISDHLAIKMKLSAVVHQPITEELE